MANSVKDRTFPALLLISLGLIFLIGFGYVMAYIYAYQAGIHLYPTLVTPIP